MNLFRRIPKARKVYNRASAIFQRCPMSHLPVFRLGSRARSTSLGIALCTMFIVASFSVVGGLKASMDRLESNFSSNYYLVTRSDGLAPFDPADITSILDKAAYGYFVDVTLDVAPGSAAAFCLQGDISLFPSVAQPSWAEVYVPSGVPFGPFTLDGPAGTMQVKAVGLLVTDLFPTDWILGSRELVDTLSGESGKANFAITDSLTADNRAHLASDGFSVQSTTGIIDFLGQSIDQIQDDVALVLLPSTFVVAMLSYGFIGAETADKRHEIGVLKTIGLGRRKILSYLLSNAFLVSLWGGLLGLALGILVSYGLSTAASALFTTAFIMRVDPSLLLLALIATVVASLAGSLVPAMRMTLTRPVQDLKEAPR